MTDDATTLLREMRDQQQLQLERSAQSLQHQVEALALQQKQFDLYQQQFERVERINARAESIQDRVLEASKLVMWVLLPLLGVVLLMQLWPRARSWAS
jgi:ABC-type uncharacterized transport system involved in gliding motility auxiliary subunit